MATKFKKGDLVEVKAVNPNGPVEALRMDEEGNFYYLLSWVDADGTNQQRWFQEDQLVAQ
jgi:uncharacterized protein YodC (DUF2158 family)